MAPLSYSPQALYHLASLLYPEEMAVGDYLPIEMGGVPVRLRCETHRGEGMDMEFVMSYAEQNRPVRIITVYLCGSVEDEIMEAVPTANTPSGPAVEIDKDEALRLIFSLLLLHHLRQVVNVQLA